MKISKFTADILLLCVAVVWGTTFPVVKNALSSIEPMWFLTIRFAFAALFLVPFFIGDIRRAPTKTWRNGVTIGLFLFASYAFQTIGLSLTTASKTAFITGLYLVVVPLITAVLVKRLPSIDVGFGVFAAVVGLGLLSLEGRLVPEIGDVLVLLCAIGFAGHIIAIERLGKGHSAGVLTITQIAVVSILSLISAVSFEAAPVSIGRSAWTAIIATGILATSAAFLIQTSAQQYTTSIHAALILAMEPVFAAFFAYWWAGERLTTRGITGAILMFLGMMVVEFEPISNLLSRAPRAKQVLKGPLE